MRTPTRYCETCAQVLPASGGPGRKAAYCGKDCREVAKLLRRLAVVSERVIEETPSTHRTSAQRTIRQALVDLARDVTTTAAVADGDYSRRCDVGTPGRDRTAEVAAKPLPEGQAVRLPVGVSS